jgi:hypothetical protein
LLLSKEKIALDAQVREPTKPVFSHYQLSSTLDMHWFVAGCIALVK